MVTIAPNTVGRYPGEDTKPRSSCEASNCVTHSPILSPCCALFTGFLNIWIDLTFLDSFNADISTI